MHLYRQGRISVSSSLEIRGAASRHLQHNTLSQLGDGGAYRDRTDDLMLAKQLLSQLS